MSTAKEGLRVLVVGGGGREHALAWACRRSPLVAEVLVAPGNPGTALLGRNVAVSVTDAPAVASLAAAEAVDLVILGPDAAIAAGVGDGLAAAGIPCFGPTKAAGELETSKAFAKRLMARIGIPTAPFQVFADPGAAELHLRTCPLPVVVKADGLALGKGAFVCTTLAEARDVVRRLMVDGELGAAGRVVVIEDCLRGAEVSLFALCDGERSVMLPPARDYKRSRDGDGGEQTGGMGAYTPPQGIDWDNLNQLTKERVVDPVLQEMRRLGRPFVGCLYVGGMLVGQELYVLEFNARFGDPETEVLLPALADPVPHLLAAAAGELGPAPPALTRLASVGVVAVRDPYPAKIVPGGEISGIERAAAAGCVVFQMGTAAGQMGLPVVAGGRVLICVATGDSLGEARALAYRGLAEIRFQGMRYRGDIAS
ncbi:MAG: phosphoribosylamine--glycine ligase [Candidatus Dormibacteraeota bacterium]|nr:phosphoribosylamine--glycine ligase [Candidatus Dormibacteraeota bacterium]